MIKKEHELEENIWDKLFELGNHQEFNSGDIIYKQNEPSTGLIYFQQGKIKLYTNVSNIERTVCVMEQPYILGESSLIDGGTNICTAVALTKTKIVFVSKEAVQTILLSYPDFMYVIMGSLAKKIRYMQLQVEDAAFRLPQRLARLLLCYNEYKKISKEEQKFILHVTHNELAQCLGTTRPKISEHLNNFYRNGLIEKNKVFIKIKDYEGLKHIAGKFSSM